MEKLNNNQIQVMLTGTFGDGSVSTTMSTGSYKTNCKMKEYLDFKSCLLGDLSKGIKYIEKNGYSQTYIWDLRTKPSKYIKEVHEKSLVDKLNMLDELGICMWIYDDGSLHKRLKFYNINSHSFNESDNKVLSNFINKKLGIFSRVMTERKKDGRVFYYLYIPPCGGAYKISDILDKYPFECYRYKRINEDDSKDLRSLHEYVDKKFTAGTEEHYNEVTSLRLRLSGFRKKNKELMVEEFIKDYIKNLNG